MAKTMDKDQFGLVFKRLKMILEPYAATLVVKCDDPTNYYLETPFNPKYKKEVFFSAVQIKKNYVSFHLMPIYIFPDLLESCSPALKKRMQGKACFNFTTIDESLMTELTDLVRQGRDRFRQMQSS